MVFFKAHFSRLIFLSGICSVVLAAQYVEGSLSVGLRNGSGDVYRETAIAVAPVRDLSVHDIENGRVAWMYFETHFRSETGLVDSVAGFPSTTLWDQGGYLFALLSARDLDLISSATFDLRVKLLLEALGKMKLFDRDLPNKVYNTKTLEMVDYDNTPVPVGVGWSALDVMRLLSSLKALRNRHSEYSNGIDRIISEWNLSAIAQEGVMIGTSRRESEIVYLQEGRLGYEQYGARIGALYGLDTFVAASTKDVLDWTNVNEVSVPIDRRKFESLDAITPIVSEPFFLQVIELGFNSENTVLAAQVYLAQEARFHEKGIATMVSEDHIDREPFFLYSSVTDGQTDWAVISEDGVHYPNYRTISLKAAFAWDAIYDRDYTHGILSILKPLAGEDGWKAGIYEEDSSVNSVVTLNTNAVVLEALSFKKSGPLLWQNPSFQ